MSTLPSKVHFSSLKCLVACAALLAGCDIDIGGGTTGDEGELEFAFTGNEFLECFGGCDVDRPIAVGAGSTLRIDDDTAEGSFTVRVPQGVEALYTETFECQRITPNGTEDDFRTIQAFESCNEDEERSANRTVTVTPSQPGPLLLEVLQDGVRIDSIELIAQPVASAVILDVGEQSQITELAVKAGTNVNISADLLDAQGAPLYFDTLDGQWSTGDESVAHVENFWLNFGGTTSVALLAEQPGTTTLRFEGAGVLVEIPTTVE